MSESAIGSRSLNDLDGRRQQQSSKSPYRPAAGGSRPDGTLLADTDPRPERPPLRRSDASHPGLSNAAPRPSRRATTRSSLMRRYSRLNWKGWRSRLRILHRRCLRDQPAADSWLIQADLLLGQDGRHRSETGTAPGRASESRSDLGQREEGLLAVRADGLAEVSRHAGDGLQTPPTAWPQPVGRKASATMLGRNPGVERSDQDLAVENLNGELVTVIELAAWSRLRLGGLDLAVQVAAEDGGPAAVTALVHRAHIVRPSRSIRLANGPIRRV
jgi:hypothetical protein